MWFKKHDYAISNVSPVRVVKKVQVKEGFPVERIRVERKDIIMNDYATMCKYPKYDSDDLQKALGTGKEIKKVSSFVLSPDRIENVTAELEDKINEKISKINEIDKTE